MPGPKQFAMTLRDVSDRLRDLPEGAVGKAKKSELRSAINSFVKAIGRDASEIIADAPHINHLLKDALWQRLGISPQAWSNIQTRLRTGLQLAGVDIRKRRNFKLAPEWDELLGPPLPEKKRQNLSRFGGYCTVRGIAPPQVSDSTFQEFLKFNHEQLVQRDPRERWQEARRAWNVLVGIKPELGLPFIANTEPPRWRGFKLEELPGPMQEEIEALLQSLLARDLLGAGEDEPLALQTIKNHIGNLRRFVSRLVESGVPLSDLTNLSTLISVSFIRRCFKYQLDLRGKTAQQLKDEGDPTIHVQHAALITAAKHCGVGDDVWAELRRFGRWGRPRQAELTLKNRERIAALSHGDIERRYLGLSLEIAERLSRVTEPTIAEALDMQTAAGLEFLIKSTNRIKNVASLDLDRHIRRPAGVNNAEWIIHFDAHETKGKVAINIMMTTITSALLDRYLKVFRPVLLRNGKCSAFFVTKDGLPKSKEGLAKQIKKAVRRELGEKWNPHIVRSHAGWMILEEAPNAHRSVQQLLQHKNLNTTVTYYLGAEREKSHAIYDAMIERRRRPVIGLVRASGRLGTRGKKRGAAL